MSPPDESAVPPDSAPESPQLSLFAGATFFFVAFVMFAAGSFGGSGARLLYQLSAVGFLSAAVFLAAALTAAARNCGPIERHSLAAREARPGASALDKLRRAYGRVSSELRSIDWRGDWLPVMAAVVPSLVALYEVCKAWNTLGPQPSASWDEWIATILIVAAFPVLVYQRHFAQLPPGRLPESAALERALRLPIFCLLLLGIASALRWVGLSWWIWIEHLVDIVIGIVALELLLRSFACLFIPLLPVRIRRSHADSFFAGLIRAQWPDLSAINAAISDRFGIDFARSWALAFIRRASLRVLCGMALLCWLLTGVTALGISDRAVYEAFGKPRAVFLPGLHLHLPWPFGVLRPVEYGVVHEIPIVAAATAETIPQPRSNVERAPIAASLIESAAPPSADRLWTADHPSEASYLVASNANGRQSFEIANIDLSIVYRIGLSDTAARDVVYHVASPQDAIRAAAGQMLARYFARSTLADVLGQNREAFIRGFEQELQARLAALDTGIEVMGVVVEAIHPPSGAAASYQGVQAAAIRAQVSISTARAAASTLLGSAQEEAIRARNEAAAAAVERVDQAKAALALFSGDHRAHLAGGQAFLFERRLEHVGKGLAGMPLVIIDHRITNDNALTLDVRPLSTNKSTDVPDEP